MEDRERLILENIPLVFYCLRKYYPTRANDEDLIQCGTIGLINAVDKRNNIVGRFSTYAIKAIKNEIMKELKRRSQSVKTISLDEMLERKKDSW